MMAAVSTGQTKKALEQRDSLFKAPKVLEIAIEITKADLDSLRRDPRTYVRATLRQGGKEYADIGVHIKGAAGSWRGIDSKPGLTINMNKFGSDQLFHGMDKFHLANSVQDPSYANELICGELFREAGVPASRISHALVTINGTKRGLYYLKEGYDKYFLRQHFGDSNGNLYDGGFLRDVDQPLQLVSSRDDAKDRNDLKSLVAAAREPDHKARVEKLAKALDMDRFASYLALESMTWDWDGYPMNRNNYRIYHDKKQAKLVFMPSGMDQMFGNPGGPVLPGFQGLIARSLMETADGKRHFLTRMAEIRSDVYKTDKIFQRLDGLKGVLAPAAESVEKGAGAGLSNQIDGLKQRVAQRAASIDSQLASQLEGMRVRAMPPGEFMAGSELVIGDIRHIPEKADSRSAGRLFWRPKGQGNYSEAPLAPTSKNRYKATIPGTATRGEIEYYIEVVESSGKKAFEPPGGAAAPFRAVPDISPPGLVPELKAVAARHYRVSLAWTQASDDRAVAGYEVHRGAADGFPATAGTLLAKLPPGALAFSDNAPPPRRQVWYAVRAVDAVNREGPPRHIKVDVPDVQPPLNTARLQARGSVGAILVNWSGEMEPIVTAVEVHRGEGKDGPSRKVAEISDMKKPFYLDKDAREGVTYRYFIRPRSNAGLLGEAGNSAEAATARYVRRINCGGPAVPDDDGVPWEADMGNGHPFLKYGGTRAWRQEGHEGDVLMSERWARTGLGYEFKVQPGRYEVVLQFAETNEDFSAKGKRLFDIIFNDKTVASKVDVFSLAGGAGKPWRFRSIVDVTGTELEIKLMANPVGPAIKAIEVRSAP